MEYRQVVRKLDILSKKQKAATDYSFSALQSQIFEKSKVVKSALDSVLSAELTQAKHTQEVYFFLFLILLDKQ